MSKLKECRESKGLKLFAVADYLGVSRHTYASYEKNPTRMSVSQANTVCDLLGCSMQDIFLSDDVGLTNNSGDTDGSERDS